MMLPGQRRTRLSRANTQIEYVVRIPNTLQKVLAHTGLTIHDVVNCPVAKSRVFGYFKLTGFITQRCEVIELEKQWNPLGM